jgi:hypothetical protein
MQILLKPVGGASTNENFVVVVGTPWVQVINRQHLVIFYQSLCHLQVMKHCQEPRRPELELNRLSSDSHKNNQDPVMP